MPDVIPITRQRRALRRAQTFFAEALQQDRAARAALDDRALPAGVADSFEIGYAPDDWQALLRAVDDNDAAVAAGVAARSDHGRVYARFRGRLMFPIRDAQGALAGFGGRALGSVTPKYLNGPETDLFDKSTLLYGWPQALAQPAERALHVTEGFFDAMAGQAAERPTVATLGTSLSATHAAALFAARDRVVLCFDSDAAGQAATRRALMTLLGQVTHPYRQVYVAALPEGLDPDSLRREQGEAAVRRRLDAAPNALDWLIDDVRDDPRGLHYAFNQLLPYATAIPDPYTQSMLLDAFAELDDSLSPRVLADYDDNLHYLGDPTPIAGRERAPMGVSMTSDQARSLLMRSLYATPDAARFVSVPQSDALLGDAVLREVARVGQAVQTGHAITREALVARWARDPALATWAQVVQEHDLLSPALAKEGMTAGTGILLEQTTPGLSPQPTSLPSRRSRSSRPDH